MSRSDNGHADWWDGVADKTEERLGKIGKAIRDADRPPPETNRNGEFAASGANGASGENGTSGENGDGGHEPPHNIARHPEDPGDALQRVAREVCDPEAIRGGADWLGKTGQAIEPQRFEWLIRPLFGAIHSVRAGAIVIPAQREAGEKLEFSAGTEPEVARILTDGEADGAKADRIEGEIIPRLDAELAEVGVETEKADEHVATAEQAVDRRREQQEAEDRERPQGSDGLFVRRRTARRRGSFFSRISLSTGKATLAFGAEVTATTAILTPNLADIANVPLGVGALIALAVSVAVLAASFAAGTAFAALRLSGWLVGVAMLALYTAVLTKFVPGLDALREVSDAGIETLTAGTLATLYLAGVTGYLRATTEDQAEEAEAEAQWKRAGTPLGDALNRLDDARERRGALRDRHAELKREVAGLWQQVEDLRDSMARSQVTALERIRQGTEAEAAVGTITATADSGVEQEMSAAEWAVLIALLSHRKARAEKPPEDRTPVRIAIPGPDRGEPIDRPRGPGALSLAALAALAAGGASGIVLGAIPLGIGVTAAAALLLADQLLARRGHGGGRERAEERPKRPSVVSPASEETQFYVHQPDRMKAKYADGGADSGERQ